MDGKQFTTQNMQPMENVELYFIIWNFDQAELVEFRNGAFM